MLSRKFRISAEKFPEVTRGRVFQNDHVRVVIKHDENLKNPKYAVIVPNKIAKMAVTRNLVRRRVYSILGSLIENSPRAYISIYPKSIESTTEDFYKSLYDVVCLKK